MGMTRAAGRTDVEPERITALEQRLDLPQPRVALGVALRGLASAAIDVSDGLTGDLGHVLTASRVGATLDLASIPCGEALRLKLAGPDRALALGCVLSGGDDYELCFTVASAMRERVDGVALALGLPLSPIGTITVDPGLSIRGEQGESISTLPRAFDHFG